jgi:hypothetical protein
MDNSVCGVELCHRGNTYSNEEVNPPPPSDVGDGYDHYTILPQALP